MFLRSGNTLQEVVIQSLSGRSNITAKEISTFASRALRHFSIQAIYKELRKLEERGAVVRAGGRYSLSLTWAMKLIQLSDEIERTYLSGKATVLQLPDKKGEVSIWRFSNLKRLDDFWIQAMLALLESAEKREMFQWVPQPWFHLLQHEREIEFQRTVRNLKCRIYMIVGGRGYLHKALRKFWSRDVYNFTLARSSFENQRTVYLNIVGDYILRIRLDQRTTRKIEAIFKSVTSADDLTSTDIQKLMTAKASISVRLWKDPKRATELKRRFCTALKLPIGQHR